MPSIADVYTTVLPDTSKIAAGIKSAFRDVDSDAREAGRRWGREIQSGIGDVEVELQADTAKAEAQIDVAARDRTVNIDIDTDRLVGSVEAAAPAMIAQAASTGGQMGSSMGGAMQGPLMAAGIAALAGIASAASGALALAPAGLLGAGSVIGTLALGLDGVKDAWDSAGKAAKASGSDQESQAKSVASAQKSLTSATKDEERAQKDVATARKQARQQLADLNLELRGGALDVKQAQLDAVKARQDLASGMFETSNDYEQAQLRVLQADQRVAEAQDRQGKMQADATDKRAKGVEGADQVVAANDRVADAHQRVADAQQSVNDAASKTSSAADAAAAAMAALSPQAQNFVNALTGLKPAFDSFKMAVQDALFANLGPQLQQLAGQYLPILQTAFTGLAGTINQSMSGLMSWLGQPQTMAAMQTIFANIGESFKIWSQSLKPVSDAFLTITQVGSGFLPQLADMVVKAANAFNDFIQKAAASGQLNQWIQTGITAFSTFGDILTVVGKMFIDLAPLGQPLLELVKSVLTALEPAIGPLATALGALVTAATPLLTIAAQLVTTLIQGIAPALTQWWTAMAPIAQTIANALLPVLQQLAPVIAQVGLTIATQFTNAIQQLAPYIGPLAQQFSQLLQQMIPMIPQVFNLVVAMSPLFQAVMPLLTQALITLMPYVIKLMEKLTNLAAIVIPPLTGILEVLSAKFGEVWPKISNAVKTAWDIIKPILDVMSGTLKAVGGPLGTIAGIVSSLMGSPDTGPGKLLVPGNSPGSPSIPGLGSVSLPGLSSGIPGAGAATGQTGMTGLWPGGGGVHSAASTLGPVDISPSVAAAAGSQPIYQPGTTGLPPWVTALASQFNLTASTYPDGGTLHQGGYAADFNGAPADLERFAQYIQSNLSGQTLQLIYQAQSGQKYGIAGGAPVGPGTSSPGYYADDWAGHSDLATPGKGHVHWATDTPVGTVGSSAMMPPGGLPGANVSNYAPPGMSPPAAALTASSTKDQIAAAIISEAQRRGFNREQTIAVLSTAMQESGLNPTASGGGGAWHGIFQQDTSYPGRDNPNTNISAFFDRLGAPQGDAWSQIFGLQQGTPYNSPGARTAYMSEIQSQTGAASALYDKNAGAATPAGTAQDPTYIALSPNIPPGQQKAGPGGSSGGQQLGQDFVSGIMQVFGLGDIFPDPTQFGLFKLFKGFAGLKPAAGGQGARGGDGAALPGIGGGGGGDLFGGLASLIPQPFGQLKVGSPGDAPTPFMPSMPRSGGGSGGLGGMMASNTPGQGNVVDQRVDLSGSKFGYSPTQVQDQIRSGQMAATRQPIRHLPS